MSGEIRTELQIPDLWFDFYARFLPGSAFVGALRAFVLGKQPIPADGLGLVAFGALAYFCGLIVQPGGSSVAGHLERRAEKLLGKPKDFVKKVRHELGLSSRQAMILSKMHGEVTFFTQLCLLSIVFCVVGAYKHLLPAFAEALAPPEPLILISSVFSPPLLGALALALYSYLGASNVAVRRVKRADSDLREKGAAGKTEGSWFE